MKKKLPYIGINLIGIRDFGFLDSLKEEIKKNFYLECRTVQLLDNIDFAYHEGRNQYYSTEILKKIEELSDEECFKILAITEEDLFIPILTYVFGEAQLDGKAAIVSLLRLRPSILTPKEFIKFQDRIIKESLHELGHTFGLTHCRDRRCIMHYCRNIFDVDNKENRFCFFCENFITDRLKEVLGNL